MNAGGECKNHPAAGTAPDHNKLPVNQHCANDGFFGLAAVRQPDVLGFASS